MKLKIPLFKQKGRPTCGPVSLRMALAYLGKNISEQELEKLIVYKEGKATFSIQMALATKKLGFDVTLICKNIIPPKEDFETKFFKEFVVETQESLKDMIREANTLKVNISLKSLALEELLKIINKKTLAIVLVDWNIIKHREDLGFAGHYVILTGFDDKFVYVNNSSGRKGTRNQAIPRGIFDKARKSKLADEDILIISKQNK